MGLVALPLKAQEAEQTATAAESAEDEGGETLEVRLHSGLSLPLGAIKDWNDSLGAKTALALGTEVGFFIKSNLLFGLAFTYSQFGIDTEGPGKDLNHKLYSPHLYLKRYFFGESDFAPFVKIHAGVDFAKFATIVDDGGTLKYRELSYAPAFGFGANVGLFRYTSDYGGVFVEAGISHVLAKEAAKDYGGMEYKFGEAITVASIQAGIQVFFGGE